MKIVQYILILILATMMVVEWKEYNHYNDLNKKMDADITSYEKFVDSAGHVLKQRLKMLANEDSLAVLHAKIAQLHNDILKGK